MPGLTEKPRHRLGLGETLGTCEERIGTREFQELHETDQFENQIVINEAQESDRDRLYEAE